MQYKLEIKWGKYDEGHVRGMNDDWRWDPRRLLTLEDGTYMSRNVGKHLPLNAA
jgi:hypothetical protein